MTRYAVQVDYVQSTTIMVHAATPKAAAQKAEAVARGFTNVTAAKARQVAPATTQTWRDAKNG